MGLIEQAGKRLEELRRAGVEIPEGREPAGESHAKNARESPKAFQGPKVDLDLARLAAAGFVTPNMPNSTIADEFRIIKRPLITNAFANKRSVPIRNGNLIMVTSSMPGEGKTFSAVNLAMSMAMELDRTVLLVDADVARPSVARVLGVEEGPGLMDVLESKNVDLSQVLMRTNVEKLTYLSSGRRHARATEMLASDAMSELLEDLRTRYADRIVIFDSPPLLITTESRVLATHMGQIVFVVHAETTLQSNVKRALAAIESCPVKMILLNGARTAGQGAHGYGYGYGYGH